MNAPFGLVRHMREGRLFLLLSLASLVLCSCERRSYPLHEAARRGDVAKVRRLLERGADLEVRCDQLMTPMEYAAIDGYVDVVGVMLDQDPTGYMWNFFGVYDAMTKAAWYGHSDVVRLFLSRGLYVNARDSWGRTMLHHAYENDLMAFLLQNGADPNAEDNMGATPLHLHSYDPTAVKLLLAHGADVYASNMDGRTPLHYATSRSVPELIGAGARVEARDNAGRTPLHLAMDNAETCRSLLDAGASAEARDNKGATPLHTGAESCLLDPGSIELLLSRGADVNARDDQGRTPLHWAMLNDRYVELKLLLKYGADPNLQDHSGATPLAVALIEDEGCDPDHPARTLIEHGAAVNATTKSGKTLLDLALSHGHPWTAKVLRAHGGKTSAELGREAGAAETPQSPTQGP